MLRIVTINGITYYLKEGRFIAVCNHFKNNICMDCINKIRKGELPSTQKEVWEYCKKNNISLKGWKLGSEC